MKFLRPALILLLVAVLCACSLYMPASESLHSNIEYVTDNLTVHFLDVGQADCHVVTLPTGEVMMIDFGNNDDASFICNYLNNLDINVIDYLVATHPHEDHIGAMDTIINKYEIRNVYMTDAEADTKSYRDVQKALSKRKIGATILYGGTVIYSDEELKIETLAPMYYYDDLNNMSIVVRITYKEASFLFTGDAEEESENDITGDVSSDVLAVGHHGSSTSTSDRFLERVDPMFAVISCGKNNDYGHPHWETLEKLEDGDVTVYRTDTLGTIVCTTKGEKGDYKWEMSK